MPHGESALLAGPSGSGKSTLFRAISGIWPYGEGSIHIPDGASVMVVPQKPYIPMGTLRAAVTYPTAPDAYTDEEVRQALVDVRLGNLLDLLDREEMWSQRLSGGEQQRVALARALLTQPDWLFLDESTSALDEKLEAELYKMLATRLPKTTLVSIGHRSTLGAFHDRRIDMTADRGRPIHPARHAGRGGGVARRSPDERSDIRGTMAPHVASPMRATGLLNVSLPRFWERERGATARTPSASRSGESPRLRGTSPRRGPAGRRA